MNRLLVGVFLGTGFLLASCQITRSGPQTPGGPTPAASAPVTPAAPVTPVTPASTDQTAIQHHVDDLAVQIGQLEDQLGHGKGAMRNGSSFSVDSSGQESLLERLRRLEKEITQANAQIAAKDKLISDLHVDLSTSKSHGDSLAEQTDALAHVRDNLVTARQELADRQGRLDATAKQLAQSELARLRAERSYYLIAGGLLKLAPGQTQELIDLQEVVRNQVKDLHPVDASEIKEAK